jgi:hypothetical protein
MDVGPACMDAQMPSDPHESLSSESNLWVETVVLKVVYNILYCNSKLSIKY